MVMAASILPAPNSDSACSIEDEPNCGFDGVTCSVCAEIGKVNKLDNASNGRTFDPRSFIAVPQPEEPYFLILRASQEYPASNMERNVRLCSVIGWAPCK